MSSTSPPIATTKPLTLTLELEHRSESALLRAISLLHRRRCRITRVEYRSGTGPCDRLTVWVEAPRLHAHRVEAWLAALVEVHGVNSTIP